MGHIDLSQYALITGPVNEDKEKNYIAQVKHWSENIQKSWVGASSWMRQYVAAVISWHDYQVLINQLNRNVKLLSLVPNNEPNADRVRRRERARKYKKALRIH
jgi:hypothetical protein